MRASLKASLYLPCHSPSHISPTRSKALSTRSRICQAFWLHCSFSRQDSLDKRRRSKSEEHAAPGTSASDADDIWQESLAPLITHTAATGKTWTAIEAEPVTSGLSQGNEHIGDAHGGHAPDHDMQSHTRIHRLERNSDIEGFSIITKMLGSQRNYGE